MAVGRAAGLGIAARRQWQCRGAKFGDVIIRLSEFGSRAIALGASKDLIPRSTDTAADEPITARGAWFGFGPADAPTFVRALCRSICGVVQVHLKPRLLVVAKGRYTTCRHAT